MSYNILVLHNLPDFSNTLKSAADYILCFERYSTGHNFIYQRISDPDTPSLREIRFDIVILDATALGICRYRPRELYYHEKERWSFLGESDAVKLAFPQDDYHESAEMDALFDEWGFDQVYSVIPENIDAVYPRMFAKDRVKTVLTGYVDDNSIDYYQPYILPFEKRKIDIGQRVQFYPPNGGRHAQLKGRLAKIVRIAALEKGMSVDIDTTPACTLLGDNWLHFLGECRFVTGAEGGVSIFDPHGAIYDKTLAFLSVNPEASFEEVESACFHGEDGRLVFSAISPRLFEAAMMRCGQLLVEAPYLGVLEPFEHYIPIKPDLSDVGEAVDMVRDNEGALKRIEACYEALVETHKFRYSFLVEQVFEDVANVVARRHVKGSPKTVFNRLKLRHEEELKSILEPPPEPTPELEPEPEELLEAVSISPVSRLAQIARSAKARAASAVRRLK